MTVTTRHVFWGTAVWVISAAGCLSNDVQLVEISRGEEREPFTAQGSAGNGTGAPSGGAAATGGSGGSGALVNVAGGTSIGGAGGGAGTTVGSGGAEAVLAGGAAGEGAGEGGAAGASGASGDGGNAGATSTCVPGAACLTVQARLPAPCAGIPYSELVSISGGTGPYAVQLLSPPGELELRQEGDEWRVVSTGNSGPTAGAVLEVEVTDGSSPPLTQTVEIDLSLRDSCWLAYLAEDGPSRLHFRDVFLQSDVVLPSGDVTEGVVDFKFSPDGDWLAFRVGEAPSYRLFTYDTRGAGPGALAVADPVVFECPREGGVAAPCGVLDYAWSRDSNHLGVVLNGATPEQDYLSGISGFNVGASPRERWATHGTARWVADDVPLDYREQLVWVDSAWLGFLGPELSSTSSSLTLALYAAALSDVGISRPEGIPSMLTTEGTLLRPSQDGMVMIEPTDDVQTSLVSFYALGEFPMYHLGWLSPSGSWVAWVSDGQELEIYDVRDDFEVIASSADAPSDPPGSPPGSACSAVFSWSEAVETHGIERIACSSQSGVTVYDFHYAASPKWLERIGHIDLSPVAGVRRAFSSQGRWLALGRPDGDSFWLTDLSGPTPIVSPLPVQLQSAPVELTFPPNENGFVTVSDIRGLTAYPLPGTPHVSGNSVFGNSFQFEAAQPRSPCEEAFWSAPGNWCGAPRAAQHLEYSPDGRSLVFEEASGFLKIAQPGAYVRATLVTDKLKFCSSNCADLYAFRP